MTNLLDLPLDQFRGYLAEGNYPQARQDELMRAYRAQNSLSGLLDRYGEEGLEGKNVSSYFPVAVPKGMSILDGLKSGRFQTRFKDYASDALGGVLGALENPRAAYQGTLPQADYDGAAMGTAGLAMGGGGVVAGRNIGATNANASKSAGLLAASLPEPRNAGGLLGAAQQTKTPTMPTRKQFQNNHLVHVDVKGRQGRHDSQEVKASVLKNGFTGGQLLPAYKGGTPTNIIDEQYAPRKGDVIYVIPPEGWESRNGMEYIKKGYKPRPNFIIEAPEDFIDVYDVFSKSQAKTRKKQ